MLPAVWGKQLLPCSPIHPAVFDNSPVTGLPRSGKPEELLEEFGISASRIVETVRELAG